MPRSSSTSAYSLTTAITRPTRSVSARGTPTQVVHVDGAAGGAGGAAGGACGGGLGGSREQVPRRAGDAGLQRERPGFKAAAARKLDEAGAVVGAAHAAQQSSTGAAANASSFRLAPVPSTSVLASGPRSRTASRTGRAARPAAAAATAARAAPPATAAAAAARVADRRRAAGTPSGRGATACSASLLEVAAAAEVDEAARRSAAQPAQHSSVDDTSFITLPPVPSPTSRCPAAAPRTPCRATARRAAPAATAARRRRRARACRTVAVDRAARRAVRGPAAARAAGQRRRRPAGAGVDGRCRRPRLAVVGDLQVVGGGVRAPPMDGHLAEAVGAEVDREPLRVGLRAPPRAGRAADRARRRAAPPPHGADEAVADAPSARSVPSTPPMLKRRLWRGGDRVSTFTRLVGARFTVTSHKQPQL